MFNKIYQQYKYLFLVCVGLYGHKSFAQGISLDSVTKLALERNLIIQSQKAQEKVLQLQVLLSTIDQIPQIGVSAYDGFNFGRNIDPTSNTFINQRTQVFSTNGFINGTIYEGGKKQKQIELDKKTVVLQQQQIKKTELDIKSELLPVFFQAFYFQEEQKILNDINKVLWQYHQQQKVLWGNNLKTYADTFNTYTRWIEGINKKYVSNNNFISALKDIEYYIQDTLSLTIHLNAALVKNIFDKLNVLLLNNQESLFNQHPEVQIQNQQLVLNKLKQENFKAAYYPRLSYILNANTAYSSAQKEISLQNNLPVYKDVSFGTQLDNNFRQAIGIQLDFSFTNLYTTRKQLKKIELEKFKIENDKQQIIQKIKYQVNKSYLKYLQAQQEYETYIEIEQLAEKNFHFYDEKAKSGLANWFEWFQILSDWQSKQINLLRLKVNVLQEIEKLKLIELFFIKNERILFN